MARRFKKVDYEKALDQTVTIRECLPPDHLARFIVAIIALLVYLSSNSDVWAFYKLWVQPLLLLYAPLGLIVRLVDKQ